jgi:hypothetical protein
MLHTATQFCIVLGFATSLLAAEPFDVSLDYFPEADLSDSYRALIRRATQRYRGDGNGSFTVGHVYINGYFGRAGTFETEEVADWSANHIYFFRTTSSHAH